MMSTTNPGNESCLTAEERRNVEATWDAFKAAQQPVGDLLEGGEVIDCGQLYDALLHLATAFESLERSVMRAQQIRLLHALQDRMPSQ